MGVQRSKLFHLSVCGLFILLTLLPKLSASCSPVESPTIENNRRLLLKGLAYLHRQQKMWRSNFRLGYPITLRARTVPALATNSMATAAPYIIMAKSVPKSQSMCYGRGILHSAIEFLYTSWRQHTRRAEITMKTAWNG
jgi:hypothetical protein